MQEQKDMRHVEMARSTTTKAETSLQEMSNATRDSLSGLGSSNDQEDREDEYDDEEVTELHKLSEDYEYRWVIRTIS